MLYFIEKGTIDKLYNYPDTSIMLLFYQAYP